jgi:hypothetical protein
MHRHEWLRTLSLFVALIFFAGIMPKVARADTKSDLESAEQAYANLDYDQANKLADKLSKTKGLSHDQLVRTYRILARTHAILDHENAARDAFILLMTYDPEEKGDPNQPPKVQSAFMEARGFWRGQSVKPGIEVAANVSAHTAGTLRVTTHDPTHVVKKVQVGHRWGSSGNFRTATPPVGDAQVVDVPAPPANVLRLEFYAQALDDKDNVVFESGNPGAPKSQTAEQQPSGPGGPGGPLGPGGEKSSSVFSSPVFWVVLIGALAAGGVVTFLALNKPKDEILPPTSARFGPSLNCGADRCR